MREDRHKVLLIIPSAIVSKGLEALLEESGEIIVTTLNPEVPGGSKLQSIGADAIIVSPSVFSHAKRLQARQLLSEYSSAPVLALPLGVCDDDTLRQYDAVINLGEGVESILKKVNDAIHAGSEQAKGDDAMLTAREKEVLVCVAKGMQNKEIADLFSISTYTVMSHRKNISRKTGIRSAAGLTVYALLNNLLDLSALEDK